MRLMITPFAILFAIFVALPTSAEEVTIATWNLEWFFDEAPSDTADSDLAKEMSAPSEAKYQERVVAVAAAVAEIDPDVLALQEIENRKVVEDLATELSDSRGKEYRVAFVQGTDTFTQQDVAFLVRDGLPVDAARYRYSSRSDSYKDLSKHLRLKTKLGGEQITLVTVHLMTNEESRKRQARTLRAWTRDAVESENLVLLGDFNTKTSPTSTSSSTELGIVRGLDTPTIADDFSDVLFKIPSYKRRTHKSGEALDRVLLSPSLVDGTGLRFRYITVRSDLSIRGDRSDKNRGVAYNLPADERDVSDHFPVVLTLKY